MSDDLLPSLHALSLSTVDTEMKRMLNWWKEPAEERRQIPRAPPEPIGPIMNYVLKLELYPHQAALGTAVQKARDDEDWGNTLLCTFGTGTGKTRGALFAAAQWMVSREDDVDDDGHYARIAVVILPKATMEQWRQEWEKLVTAIRAAVPSKFRDTTETPLPSSWGVLPSSSIHKYGNLILATRDAIKTYGGFFGFDQEGLPVDDGYSLDRTMLIVDEAHSLRNLGDDDNDKPLLTSSLAFGAQCGYVLLLTASPLMNTIADLNVLQAFLGQQTAVTPSEAASVDWTEEELNTRLLRRFQVPKRRIVHFSGDETNMPRPLHSYQHVLLKKSYAALATVAGEEGEYRQAQMMYPNEADEEKRMAMFRARNKVENAFLVAARQGTNDAKFEPLGFYLWTGRARRVVVASSFRAAGTDGFFNYLKSMRPAGWILTEPLEYNAEIEVLKLDNEDFPERPPMEVVRWDDNDKIGRYKEWYEDDNRSVLKVLLISPMASVGVSLKRTDEIHLLEPYWSPGLEDQVIGRVIRLDSHNEDPLKPRVNFVDVVHWKGIVPRADVDRAALGPLVDNPIDYAEESLMSADERVEDVAAEKRAALRAPIRMMRAIGTRNLEELLRMHDEGLLAQRVAP